MLIELEVTCDPAVAEALAARVSEHPDVHAWPVTLSGRRFLVVSGDESLVPPLVPGTDDGVRDVHRTDQDGYWLAAKRNGVAPAHVAVGGTVVGIGHPLWCAAGPCALESVPETIQTGHVLRAQGAKALRMGLFKARSSPYHFQGKGRAGLAQLAEISQATGLPVVTEVLDPRDVGPAAEVAACLQVDPRNMTNRALLAELGTVSRTVLLMRGIRSSVTDWLRAAEYVMAHGNTRLLLCARGVAGFDDSLAFAPDFGAIQAVRARSDLPVIYDPSHSTGRLEAVAPAALAACAFGADGLLIESYLYPQQLYHPGDGPQMYPPAGLGALLRACNEVRELATELAVTQRGASGAPVETSPADLHDH